MVYRRRPDKIGESFAKRARQTRRHGTQAPLGYSSVSEGALGILSNEGLIVDGSAKVTGWLIVTGTERVTGLLEILGTLRAAGVIEFTGPTTIAGTTEITGDTTVTGKLTVEGAWSLDGEGEITGNVGLTGDLNVAEGGRITADNVRIEDGKVYVGDLVLEPNENGGTVKFPGGSQVYASGTTLSLYSSSTGALIELGAGSATVQGPGLQRIEVSAGGYRFIALPTKTASETGLPAGVMHADAAGYMFRVVP